ncbi:MAG: amino acid decarboxylase [Bacteroidetes bacterium]|nr:amino acid decarboxylase [Bacteroidota bacterium]
MENDNTVRGDMPVEDFKKFGYQFIDWISDYLANMKDYPVLAQINPGDVKNKLPKSPPVNNESMQDILKDVNNIIMPGMTHWNHPGFMAYFNSSASGPGILAELLSGAFNINGMNWKSCPSATELEEVVVDWLRQMLKLPENFWGIIYDGGSASTMHAIAAAREFKQELEIRTKGMSGRSEVPRLRLYKSEHGHSSIDKGAITLGLGIECIKIIECDEEFKMIPSKLEEAIIKDIKEGWLPFCTVATVGTTSTTSIDPVEEISEICRRHNLWLHIDASHAGSAAIVPEYNYILNGCEKADSFVVNPHKWMFMPIDISTFFTPHKEIVKRTFSLVHEYLKTEQDNEVTNFMDYGIQLGRRFRSLKLWFVIRYFGTEGIINILREHLRLGKLFAQWIDNDPAFERLAPVPLSTVCFRAIPNFETDINKFNENLLNEINKTGIIFLSHTKLNGRFTIRLVVSHIKSNEELVINAFKVIKDKYNQLNSGGNE